MNHYRRGQNPNQHAQSQFLSKRIIWTIIVIILILIIKTLFFSGKPQSVNQNPKNPTEGMMIIPSNDNSVAYIYKTESNKEKVSQTGSLLLNTDAFLSVTRGNVQASFEGNSFDIDSNSELSFSKKDGNFLLKKGMLWAEAKSKSAHIETENLTAIIPNSAIAIVSSNTIQGAAYALYGDIDINTTKGNITIPAGKMIAISNSDLKDAKFQPEKNIRPIDSYLSTQDIFKRNNGDEVLKKYKTESEIATGSGEDIENTENKNEEGDTNTQSGSVSTKTITFTKPIDGSTSKTSTINISGTITSDDVARVTINEKEATVSPVNQTFTLTEFDLNAGVNNIVYKTYNSNDAELERGVITVTGPKNASQKQTIVPENFSVSPKDFKLISPNENPYQTTEEYVKVQGKVPKNTVHHITVNDYRLKQFKPNDATWFYHANAKIGTIKEGINLYYIRFWNANNDMLYEMPFTIIKDTKKIQNPNTTVTNEIPLFPVN